MMRYMMLIWILLCTFSGVLMANESWSQELKDAKITLHVEQESLVDVLVSIERQTRFRFSYDKALLAGQKVTLHAEGKGLDSVLQDLSQKANVSFKQANYLIAVTARREAIQQLRKIVTGHVLHGDTNEPMPGVSVLVKGTGSGTTTDSNGFFNVDVAQETAVLVFSFIGFTTREISIAEEGNITVSLVPDITSLQEVVVVGYGAKDKEDVTGSIAQLKGRVFKDYPVNNFEQGMAGRLAGVEVLQTTGNPGTSAFFRIRGANSITAGSQPLMVIDGMPISTNSSTALLNPNDIESIEVLKDASAAAIYGSRGSNGVILITTKKGDGSHRITFNTYRGVQRAAEKMDLMDAYEYARFAADARNNFWIDQNPAANSASDPNELRTNNNFRIPDYLRPYLEGQPGLTNTDWQDELFREASIANYELSASGKMGNSKFYVSGNYLDQEGIVTNTDFKKYALRTNLDMKFSDKVSLGVNVAPSYSVQNVVAEGNNYGSDGLIVTMLVSHPVFPVRNEDGSAALGKQYAEATKWGGARIENVVALAESIKNKQEESRLLAGANLDVRLVEGLTFRSYLGADIFSSRLNYFRPSFLTVYNTGPSFARGTASTRRTFNWISENTLSYDATFGSAHNLSVVAGYTAQKENIETNSVSAENFPSDRIQTINSGQVTAGSSFVQEWSLMSQFARISYDYRGKYLLTASIRRDGSSRFGENNKWGYFPSLSAGWKLSQETFFPQVAWLSTLKLRGSYGKTGNFLIPNYGFTSLLSKDDYVLGGKVALGVAPSSSPNANLSWEKTDMLDAGIDVGLLKDKINVTIDYFTSTTNDLLLNVPVPAHSGYTTSIQNIGKVQNRGWELSINGTMEWGGLKWTPSFNIYTVSNEVLALGPGQVRITEFYNTTEVGHPIGAFYGYQTLGVFQSAEDLASYPHNSTARVGSYKYKDVKEDGEITADDRTVLGDPFPDYTMGFGSLLEYGNFDLNFQLQAVQGFEIANFLKVWTINGEGWGNGGAAQVNNYFTQPDPDVTYARPRFQPTDKLYERSDLMIDDGSFVRVRNITLGYTFNQPFISRAGIHKLRAYVSTLNPFTWSRYTGYNPEVNSRTDNPLSPGIDYGNYPLAKSWVIGLNLTF